ncbi:MAG: hypothetical protein AB7E42_00040 [Anaerotignaceae bacterium]
MNLVGWKCPNCERILSPFVPSCPYCLPKEELIANPYKGKGVKEANSEPVEEPKVQLTNEILTEWIDGPAEGGGK